MSVTLHPEIAAPIARAINARAAAAEMIHTVLNRPKYKNEDFIFWRNEHIEATKKLAAFGIRLHTYGPGGWKDEAAS